MFKEKKSVKTKFDKVLDDLKNGTINKSNFIFSQATLRDGIHFLPQVFLLCYVSDIKDNNGKTLVINEPYYLNSHKGWIKNKYEFPKDEHVAGYGKKYEYITLMKFDSEVEFFKDNEMWLDGNKSTETYINSSQTTKNRKEKQVWITKSKTKAGIFKYEYRVRSRRDYRNWFAFSGTTWTTDDIVNRWDIECAVMQLAYESGMNKTYFKHTEPTELPIDPEKIQTALIETTLRGTISDSFATNLNAREADLYLYILANKTALAGLKGLFRKNHYYGWNCAIPDNDVGTDDITVVPSEFSKLKKLFVKNRMEDLEMVFQKQDMYKECRNSYLMAPVKENRKIQIDKSLTNKVDVNWDMVDAEYCNFYIDLDDGTGRFYFGISREEDGTSEKPFNNYGELTLKASDYGCDDTILMTIAHKHEYKSWSAGADWNKYSHMFTAPKLIQAMFDCPHCEKPIDVTLEEKKNDRHWHKYIPKH